MNTKTEYKEIVMNTKTDSHDAGVFARHRLGLAIGALMGTMLASSSAMAAPQKVIEFIPTSSATPYFLREYDGVKKEAKKYGYKTLFQAPSVATHISTQIGMVYTAITRKVNGIVLVPYSPTGLLPPVEKAMAHHIPVVVTDSTLTPMKALTFTAVPDKKAAAAVASYAAKMVHGHGEYAIIDYNLSDTSARYRRDGFEAAMAKFPGMKFAGLQISHSVPETALRETEAMLTSNPKINVVFGANDRSALGVAMAVKRMHLQNKVVVVGFDADLGELGYIKSGVIKASALQSPLLMGETAVKVLHEHFIDPTKKFPQYIPLPYHLVTYKNYNSPASVSAIRQYLAGYKG
ncbi:sugar ABC transporter substrate-binding protein [Acidithiobacillus sp. M4-SHS-6]|uniref:sugar ABC transporter substrate-binding protein n=1 Tax=Acidithiobacillus sp. M4-SHS-6 TaxID=3383024 RepID=UPI0039BE7C94